MVRVTHRILRFFEHESCGKCTPCREGTGWLEKMLRRIESGDGRADDLQRLQEIADAIEGTTFCPLGDGAAIVVSAMLKHFRYEFVDHIEGRGCARRS